MSTIERAIEIAVAAHKGQSDKAGAPYILHPLRVMFRVHSDEERMAAALHDVVEDCGWTFERLRAEGFSGAVVSAVDALTKRQGESYPAFVERASRHPIARVVKIADIYDNLDATRLAAWTSHDSVRFERYHAALRQLRVIGAAGGIEATGASTSHSQAGADNRPE